MHDTIWRLSSLHSLSMFALGLGWFAATKSSRLSKAEGSLSFSPRLTPTPSLRERSPPLFNLNHVSLPLGKKEKELHDYIESVRSAHGPGTWEGKEGERPAKFYKHAYLPSRQEEVGQQVTRNYS